MTQPRPSKVLLADDEPRILDLLELELQTIGCECTKALNGKEAVSKATELTPDLIVLDVQMPVMNGFEACRLLRAQPVTRFTPIIFVTSMERPDQIVQGFEAGANDYIVKLFNPPELRARVTTHLGVFRALKEMTLQEKRRSLVTLTGGLCHEMLNPLQIVLGHLSMFESDKRLACVSDQVAAMSRAAQRLQRVVTALHEYSKETIETFVPLDLNVVIESALELTRPMLEKSGLKVDTRFQKPLPRPSGVPTRLTQVFVQLFTNAAQFVPPKGVFDVRTEATPQYVICVIKDNGPGMQKSQLEQLCDPFFTSKKVWSSLGMGLAVVHRIISDHRGKLEVDSRPGKGTELRVTFPVHL
ncbi:MAG: hybrid sensor histidine kinase/response regulator [Candidatus Riflebacteria bacterium]|nr:hybrid sensor histidine kinase/response regulator [Candidatus Riflebacteria bacterium]